MPVFLKPISYGYKCVNDIDHIALVEKVHSK